ncbi:MAG: hypothetical protein KatS3mg105_2507 [Gemmatales bacterium]|nr:MAG: hypothetical protein KatS3mg105_2507 [Gemmatales bacterium]
MDRLAIYDGGGKVVNGLKIKLEASKKTIRLGDNVTFTTVLSNMTDKPMNVQVGYTTCGNYFGCGSSLRVLKDGKPVPGQWRVGICGTGAGPIYVTIPARSFVKYTTNGTFTREDGNTVYKVGKFIAFKVPENGTHQFVVSHRGDAKTNERYARLYAQKGQAVKANGALITPEVMGQGVPPADLKAPYWAGKVESNTIEIKVVE